MAGVVRLSSKKDIPAIEHLWKSCFNFQAPYSSYMDGVEDGKYFVYDVNGTIIGMTGFWFQSQYSSPFALDWCCVDPEYRKLGVMRELLACMLPLVTASPVYVSCWGTDTKSGNVHLENLMHENGFSLVISKVVQWLPDVTCSSKNTCVMYRGAKCSCFESLFCRPAMPSMYVNGIGVQPIINPKEKGEIKIGLWVKAVSHEGKTLAKLRLAPTFDGNAVEISEVSGDSEPALIHLLKTAIGAFSCPVLLHIRYDLLSKQDLKEMGFEEKLIGARAYDSRHLCYPGCDRRGELGCSCTINIYIKRRL